MKQDMQDNIRNKGAHIQPRDAQSAKVRTAAYCRVSTEREEQEGSYEIQMNYFRDKIENDPQMELAGLYGDKGKSGMKTKSRPGLQRLIADCPSGTY